MADIDMYCDALYRMSKGNSNQKTHTEPVVEPVIEEQVESSALAATGETTETLRSFILNTIKEQVTTTKQHVKKQSEKVKDNAKKIADPKQRAETVKIIEKQEAEAIAAVDRSAAGTIQSFADHLKAGESTKKVNNVLAADAKAPLREDVEMTINTKFQTEMANIRKLVATSSGGGTNAVQYKNGGTMNGNLNVEGTILSGGVDILNVLADIAGTPQTSDIVFVHSKSDLPTATSGGVITLADSVTYYFTTHIDLSGDRLLGGANTTILGGSSENCSVTSSGLLSTEYLFTSQYTTPIRHITFKDVTNAISINDGLSGAQPIALDWTGVNFSGCTQNAFFGPIDNFIFSKGAILGGGSITFDGSAGTVGIDNSIFTGSGAAYNILEFTPNSAITRRFRIIYSSFVAFGSTIGINVNDGISIPIDSYILDTCNFTGGSTYLSGIGDIATTNEPRFVNNKGIENTAAIGNYFTSDNTTATTFSAVAAPTTILATTSANDINQKFVHTGNRLTYVGELQKGFEVQAVASFTGAGQNKLIGLYVAKNGVILPDSEMYATTDGTNKAQSISIQTITRLVNNDYIEVWIENDTDTTSVVVTFLNVIIKSV